MTDDGTEPGAGDAVATRHSDAGPSNEPRWLSRAMELRLAAVGGVIALSVVGMIVLSPLPGPGTSRALEIGAPIAAALLTLALPRFDARTGPARLLVAAAVAALAHFLGPGQLITLRLRSTLASADVSLRASAVRLLTDRGVREFDGANLENADLSKSELTITSFRKANLKAVRLDDAILNAAKFDGADLTNASARGTDFYLSNPERAKGWETVQCDGNTRMPRGWRCARGRPRLIAGGVAI